METTIKISTDGSMSFLHSDPVTAALQDEGSVHIERMSDVKFNNITKLWEIFLPNTDCLLISKGFKSRAEAIAAEIEILEAKL